MRLDSGVFLVAFGLFFLLYSAVPSQLKRWLLVGGSLAFYATLSPRFVWLLLGLGIFTFLITGRLQEEVADVRRRRLLWVGVGVNALALAFFKVAAPAAGALAWLKLGARVQLLEVAVPLGMSFYTLQAISCIVDVHRRVYQPPRSLLSFLASLTLFPHLLSGPIVRASFLVPLVERVDSVTWATARRALLLFTAGLVKKAVADRLAPTADAAFDGARDISALEAWTGLVAYAAQLYGDFSGYTDMATALALLLGLDLPVNFDLPYLATSPADFWRRWHISLSTWLRDYVYLPLGVVFRRRPYVSIVLTWIVAGLWHGASPLYLLYGLYHGVLLAMTHWLSRRFATDEDVRGWRRVAQTVLTFYLVLIGYVLFRARSLSAAARFLGALHVSHVQSNASREAIATAATSALALVFCHLLDHCIRRRRAVAERAWVLWPAMALAVTGLVLFSGAAQPFIYFAF